MSTTATRTNEQRKTTAQKQQAWITSLNYGQQQRLRFLESRLLWEGEVNRRDICDQFGVTPNHFTREVRAYKAYVPSNIRYDEVTRSYRPTDKFRPVFASGDAQEYLSLLRAHAQKPSHALMAELGSCVPCDTLVPPQGHIDNIILRGILLAIHRKWGVKVRYQSFSSARAKSRTIWPHALAWTGERWHVRAFDERKSLYIDLVLTRIQSLEKVDKACPDADGVDHFWDNVETVVVIPNPDLSPGQQRVVAQEYGMKKKAQGWTWEVNLRKCMIPYFLLRFRLDEDHSHEKNRGFPIQRIVLRDLSLREKYAFGRD